jgi:hypothetical protein
MIVWLALVFIGDLGLIGATMAFRPSPSGMLALVLVGLLPIEWLFSVSAKSLAFVVWLHVALWAVAILTIEGGERKAHFFGENLNGVFRRWRR